MLLTNHLHDILSKHRARILACAFAVLLVAICNPFNAYADVRKADIIVGQTVEQRGFSVAQCPNVSAEYAIVIDSEGNTYFERNADTETRIASVTKVMTAIVSLDYANDTDMITVSEYAATVGESSANLQEGDSTDFVSMLKGLMIPSGNDAAIALAEHYGAVILQKEGKNASDSQACIDAFVRKMNDKASELGMTHSVFTNPHGLDDEQWEGELHSSARDVSKMVAYAMKNNRFREVCKIDGCDITVRRDGAPESITLEPTDVLLSIYEGACGVKTGYTNSAGACFAGAVNKDGKELYAIMLNAADELQRFLDVQNACEWVYGHAVKYKLSNSPESVTAQFKDGAKQMPVFAYAGHPGWVNVTYPVALQNPDEEIEVFDLDGNVSQLVTIDHVPNDVHAGDVVGKVEFKQHNKTVYTAKLIACADQRGPNVFESIGVKIDRFFKSRSGESTEAKTHVVNEPTVLLDKTA